MTTLLLIALALILYLGIGVLVASISVLFDKKPKGETSGGAWEVFFWPLLLLIGALLLTMVVLDALVLRLSRRLKALFSRESLHSDVDRDI